VSDSSIICTTPVVAKGKQDVAYLSGLKGSTMKVLKAELNADVEANNVTILQASKVNVSAAYAARVNEVVDFLDVPTNVLSIVVITVTADQCDKDTSVDIGFDVFVELKAGWCSADSIGPGSNMVAFVTSSANAPFTYDSTNSSVPSSQVLLGLAFSSVTLAGPLEVKTPVDLGMISESGDRRRRLLQYGGKILRQSWLNQCTGMILFALSCCLRKYRTVFFFLCCVLPCHLTPGGQASGCRSAQAQRAPQASPQVSPRIL
jgi:hypothetical protein